MITGRQNFLSMDGYDAMDTTRWCHPKNAISTDVGKMQSKISHRAIEKVFDGIFGSGLGEAATMWGARVVPNFQGKAVRSSQRLTKSQPRALNRSNKSTNTAQPDPADHQRDRSRTLKINKNRSIHDRKMIRPSFFMIF